NRRQPLHRLQRCRQSDPQGGLRLKDLADLVDLADVIGDEASHEGAPVPLLDDDSGLRQSRQRCPDVMPGGFKALVQLLLTQLLARTHTTAKDVALDGPGDLLRRRIRGGAAALRSRRPERIFDRIVIHALTIVDNRGTRTRWLGAILAVIVRAINKIVDN